MNTTQTSPSEERDLVVTPVRRTPLPPKLGRPALRALEAAGIGTLETLTKRKASDIAALHGMGPKAMTALEGALAAQAVSAYLAAQPAPMRRLLRTVRKTLQAALPDAVEGISYQIPTFKIAGRPVLYFAGWKAHYALYPIDGALSDHFAEALGRYECRKGTLRLPLDQKVPVGFITKLAKFRAQEIRARAKDVLAKSVRAKKARSDRLRR